MYIRYLLIFILLTMSAQADNSYIVMSSTDSVVQENVDMRDLRDIFLGHRILWRNGDRIFPAHIKKTTSYMSSFLDSVLSMSPRQYNKYWRRRLFSGKGHPPVEFKNDDKVLSYVQKTDGAIAIISKLPRKKYEGLHFFQPVSDGLDKVE